MIKKQHELYENRIKNPTRENIKKHTTYRNKIKKTIQQIKRKHITEQLEQTKNDPKQQAKVLNNILSINNNTKTTPTILTYEDKTYTESKDIANALNDHFMTIATKTK